MEHRKQCFGEGIAEIVLALFGALPCVVAFCFFSVVQPLTDRTLSDLDALYEELNPCPVCGSKVCIKTDDSSSETDGWFYIVCDECGLRTGLYRSESELISDWNN